MTETLELLELREDTVPEVGTTYIIPVGMVVIVDGEGAGYSGMSEVELEEPINATYDGEETVGSWDECDAFNVDEGEGERVFGEGFKVRGLFIPIPE